MTPTTNRLRRLMRRHKLTCREIATIIGMHPVTVRNWHRGASSPTKFVFEELERRLADL
jgi:transcriptional regulator with XRE-family HTH domain